MTDTPTDLVPLTTSEISVQVTPATITTTGIDEAQEQLAQIQENLTTLEVTPENAKSTKKLLAELNKKKAQIQKAITSTKRELTAPMADLENPLREMIATIGDIEATHRAQINQLDEIRQNDKLAEIAALWDEHLPSYEIDDTDFNPVDYADFDDFIKPQHLNKGYSLTKIEVEIVAHLEGIKEQLALIEALDDDIKVEVLIEWAENGHRFIQAQKAVLDRHRAMEQHKVTSALAAMDITPRAAQSHPLTTPAAVEGKALIQIDIDDLSTVSALLKESGIPFRAL